VTRPWHHRFDNAVVGSMKNPSDLTQYERLLLLVLNTKTGRDGLIPERFQPSLSELVVLTGMSRRNVLNVIESLESKGWLAVTRPPKALARADHARNNYRLLIPDGASAPDALAGGTDDGASAPRALGLVHDAHRASAPDAHQPDLSSQSHGATQPPRDRAGLSWPDELDAAVSRAGDGWDAETAAADMEERGYPLPKVVGIVTATSDRLLEQR
jgi:hypothetical protein